MADWWQARWQALGDLPPRLTPVQAQVQAPAPPVVESPNVAPDPEVQSTGYRCWPESKIILVQEANVCV